jgi:hypothetical protein
MKENETCQVYALAHRSKILATIVLNGYNISGDGPLGLQGQLRSFKLINGNLRRAWAYAQIMGLRDADGRETAIRIVGLPTDEASSGLVEFV